MVRKKTIRQNSVKKKIIYLKRIAWGIFLEAQLREGIFKHGLISRTSVEGQLNESYGCPCIRDKAFLAKSSKSATMRHVPL